MRAEDFLSDVQPKAAPQPIQQRFEPPTYQRGTDTEVDKFLDDNQKQWEGIAAHIFTERELREVKAKGPIGYLESHYKNQAIPGWTTGWKVAETLDMANLSRKYANNTITQGEKDALFAFARKQAEEQIRGYTFMGKVGAGFAQAPAFMIEFAASLGAGKLAASAALKTAEKEVVEGVAEGVAKKVIEKTVAQKVAQTAITHGVGATALIALEAPAAYGERRLNQYLTITDKGQALFTEAQEKPFTSALKAAGNVGIEYVSETSGAAIGKYAFKPVGKLISPYASKIGATLIDRVPVKVKDALFQAYKAVQPNAKVTEAFTAAGWNGMLEELGEERVGDILRVTLDLDPKQGYSFDQLMTAVYPGAEQLLVEAGVIGMIGGGRVALNGAANGLHKLAVKRGMSEKDATEMVNNLSQTELETMFSGLSAQEIRTQIQQVEGAAFEMARSQNIDEDEARQWSKVMAANSVWGAKNYGISPKAYFDRLQLGIQNYNGPAITQREFKAMMNLEPDYTGGTPLPYQDTIQTLRDQQKRVDQSFARSSNAMEKADAEGRKYRGARQSRATPILKYLNSKGGVLIGSELASELESRGITSKTDPWLFRKKDGRRGTANGVEIIPALRTLDTIEPQDISDKTGKDFRPSGTNVNDTDGYYADRDAILEAIDNEVRGIGQQGETTQGQEEWFDDMLRVLGVAGVSLEENTDEEINAALMQLERDRMSQSAFHGSPYRFDRFTLEHIGTGEGAQAYGWGLYFAGKREVAEFYRKNLAETATADQLEKYFTVGKIVQGYAGKDKVISYNKNEGWNWSVTVVRVDENGNEIRGERPRTHRTFPRKEEMAQAGFDLGQLYEVSIPEDDVLLHWDKPLSEQPQKVQESLKSALGQRYLGSMEGARLYKFEMQGFLGDELGIARTPEAASKFLNSIGIKGIKYLDRQSRNGVQGTHNYVIFDDSAIDVLNTFYQDDRAAIQFMRDGKKIISLLAGADQSSLLHETGHMFLRELQQAAQHSDIAKEHLKAITSFVGAQEGQPFTREQEETFARGFERYLMEGTAPNNYLRDAFESFREWFIEIYENVTGLNVPMNNEARAVFDALLGGKDLDIYMKPVSIENHESGWAKFYRYVVDDLAPIHRAVKAAQAIRGKFPDGTNPEWLARLFAASKGRIIENIQNQTYYIDEKGNPVITGEGFKPILEDFDSEFAKIETDYEARFNDLKEYLIARRYLEDLSQREDVEVTARQLEESAATIARISEKYGDHALRFQDYAKRIYAFQSRILENLVRSGLMSQEQFDAITKANQNYIPFQRVFEEHEIEESFFAIGGRGKFVSQSNPVKSIEGSSREVKDPFSQIIINTARVLSAAERNRVSAGIAAMSAYLPDTVKPVKQPMKKIVLDDGSVTYRPDGVPKGLVIEYRTEGKRRFVEVSKPLYEALQGMHPVEAPAFLRIFQGVASFFRAAATLPPEFWIRNFIRDVNSAAVQSKRGIKPVDVMKGILAVAQKNDLYHEWMKSGGSFNSYMELDDKGAQQALQELLRPRGRAMRYVKSFGIEALKDASGAFEQATRIAMFARAKQTGESGVAAALQSRDGTLDFSRAGKWGRVANRYIPFLNAGIQGSDRLIRAMIEQPGVMAWRAFMTISVPSIVLTGYYLYGAPDDERKEYLEIPQWQKDMFWCFKANGTWWRIPKPFALGYAFGSLPERFLLWSYQGEKPEAEGIWREFVLGLGGSLSPVQDAGTLMTPVGRIVVESLSNYNFFTDRPIYPDWMDRLPPEERATKHQSETAMLLGELTRQSPAIIENAIRGMLATTTPYAIGAGDSIINAVNEWNGDTIPEKPMTPADTLFVRGFSVRDPEGYRSVSAANFFDKWQEIQQRHASFNKKRGDERAEYMDKYGNIIRAYKPMKGFYERMDSLQERVDTIYDAEDMPGQDKLDEIRQIEKQITDIARQANQWYLSNVTPEE